MNKIKEIGIRIKEFFEENGIRILMFILIPFLLLIVLAAPIIKLFTSNKNIIKAHKFNIKEEVDRSKREVTTEVLLHKTEIEAMAEIEVVKTDTEAKAIVYEKKAIDAAQLNYDFEALAKALNETKNQ